MLIGWRCVMMIVIGEAGPEYRRVCFFIVAIVVVLYGCNSAPTSVDQEKDDSHLSQPLANLLMTEVNDFSFSTLTTVQFKITPTGFDFGQVPVGISSPVQVAQVINLGPGPVTIENMAGGAAGVFGGTQNCVGAQLAEGESCQISYRFTPTEAGEVTASTSGSINGQSFAFQFRGEGILQDRFLITPTAFDFGEVPLGDSSPVQTVDIINSGPGPVTIENMAGGAAGVFGGTQNCVGAQLGEGESCQISYRFTPTEAGEVTASTSGSINGQSFAFQFRGEGIPQDRFLITPTAYDFGEVTIGESSPIQTANVINVGPGPVTIENMAGGAAGVFGGTQNCVGAQLAEGESCQISYRFTPTEPGEVTTSTSGSINGQSFAFQFRGEGIPIGDAPKNRFLITPVAFDFGQVRIGEISPVQRAEVINIGPGPVTIENMAGGAAGVFGGTQNCVGAQLAEGESCQITYRFTPTEPGEATGSTSGSINGQSFAFHFRGEGVQRDRFLITPIAFDFGQVRLSESSPVQTADVINVGPGPVTIENMAGGAAGVFGGTQNCVGAQLAEGESCQINYRFTPTEPGEATGSTSGSINGQSFAFQFRGEGVERDRFLITPIAFDFGQVPLGESSPVQAANIINVGPGPVTIENMAGGAAGVFGGTQNCVGAQLAEGESCQISYRFTPTESGEVTRSTSGTIDGQSFAFQFRGEGIVPVLNVALDIRPQGCPNPINPRSRGVLPAAILGSADFDVMEIDPESIRLEGVAPLRWNFEDVATPFEGQFSEPPHRMDCTDEGPDGFEDLTLAFNTQEVLEAIGKPQENDVILVTISGQLSDGTAFKGMDVVWVNTQMGLSAANLNFQEDF